MWGAPHSNTLGQCLAPSCQCVVTFISLALLRRGKREITVWARGGQEAADLLKGGGLGDGRDAW